LGPLAGGLILTPPIFPGPRIEAGPLDYLHRARMFREAAVRLPDYSNGEQFWPKYALLTHAIELALKAFVRHAIELGKPAVKEPKQHDLVGWYRLAIHYGVPENPDVAENVALLNELHETHFTRYPQSRSKPVPSADIIADNTVDYLIFMTTQAVNPR
jgi:hypothetical protein